MLLSVALGHCFKRAGTSVSNDTGNNTLFTDFLSSLWYLRAIEHKGTQLACFVGNIFIDK